MNSVFETERASRGNPRAFVPYYDLISDWRAAMTRACAQVGAPSGSMDAPHAVDDFLTTSLNRSSDSWEGLTVPPALVEMADATWTAANVLSTNPTTAGRRPSSSGCGRRTSISTPPRPPSPPTRPLRRCGRARAAMRERLGRRTHGSTSCARS